MTFEEKIEYLRYGLSLRIDNLPKYVEALEEGMKRFTSQKEKFEAKIEKYKDDGFIVDMLKANIEYIDENFQKEVVKIRTDIEHAQSSIDNVVELKKSVENGHFNKKQFNLLLDLFLIPVLDDWKNHKEMVEEEQAKEETDDEAIVN